MTRSSRPLTRPLGRCNQLLMTSAVALVLTALPVGLSSEGPALSWHTALAKNDGGGSGGGSDNGRGNGPGASEHGNRGNAYGHDREHGSEGRGADGYYDFDEFVDSVRSGKALGLQDRDERIAEARGRYQDALTKANRGKHLGQGLESADGVGPAAHRFSPEETQALIARGWRGPSGTTGFRSHGERVRTMVELAKRLGYGARVGALQANFGTPYENDIAALEAELAAAQAAGDDAEVERLEAELAAAIENAKPGVGPDDAWATADLDVNDDGVVDQRDLAALDETESAGGTGDESPAS